MILMAKKGKFLTITVLVITTIFLGFSAIGVWRYGWSEVIDEIIRYAIGGSAFALTIAILAFVFRKKIWVN